MVRTEQDAHATDAKENTANLRPVVADTQEQEREDDDDDNSPEVDELSGENGSLVAWLVNRSLHHRKNKVGLHIGKQGQ